MRSFSTKGNAVSAYTASPSRAFLVEIACFSSRGILDPAGMTAALASCEAAVAAAGCATAGSVWELAGCGELDFWQNPRLAGSKIIHAQRIVDLRNEADDSTIQIRPRTHGNYRLGCAVFGESYLPVSVIFISNTFAVSVGTSTALPA